MKCELLKSLVGEQIIIDYFFVLKLQFNQNLK